MSDSADNGGSSEAPLFLVGCDFSEASEQAVSEAGRLAATEEGRVLVVFCLSDDMPPMLALGARERAMESHREHALEQLRRLADERLSDVPHEVMVIDGLARRELVNAAKSEGADLLVVASRGHSLAAGLLLGSTAESVVRHAPCSVLILR